MLGEQGWPGFILWLLLHLGGLVQMEIVRHRARDGEDWAGQLGASLQGAHAIYLVGSLFVGIAFESFAYMLIGVEIALAAHCRRERLAGETRAWGAPGGARATPTAVSGAPALARTVAQH